MSERPVFATPVAGTDAATGTGWRLGDESATPKRLVYEDFGDSGRASVAQRLGVGFGTSAVTDDGTLVCGVRPGEWLLLGGSAPPHLTDAITVDLTHGIVMFRLTGPAAPALLAHVCSIDTAEEMMPDGAVCGASVARVACTLVRNDAGGECSYLILADRSYGRYLFDAVRDAGEPEPSPPASWSPVPPGTAPPN